MNFQLRITRFVAALIIVFWLTDSFFDSWLSVDGISFLESCFTPSFERLLIRGIVVLLLLVSNAFTEKILNRFRASARETERILELEIEEYESCVDKTVTKQHREARDYMRELKEQKMKEEGK